jgi:hypothetical protein
MLGLGNTIVKSFSAKDSFIGLLDTYSGAAAAYSLRKLKSDYTGPAISVRNASNVDLDIGFNGSGELDTVSLLTHTGSGDGFVAQWYDQSGSGNHATQDSEGNQPKIVSSGAVEVDANGKPEVLYSSTYECGLVNSVSLSQSFTVFCIYNPTQGYSSAYGTNQNDLRTSPSILKAYGNDISGGNSVTGKQLGAIVVGDGSNSGGSSFFDTAQPAFASFTHTSSFNMTVLGNSRATRNGRCNLSELIVWPVAHNSNNRAGIEINANTFYNIYS